MANNYLAVFRNKDIPHNSDKFLFAIDLVHFVIDTKWPEYADRPKNLNGSESYRDQVYNAFTGDIRNAVGHLVEEMSVGIENHFEAYLQNNDEELSEQTFMRMVDEWENKHYIGDSITKRNLLRSFVCLALLAGHFYSRGLPGPETAMNVIVCRFPPEEFENSKWWDTLNEISRGILGLPPVERPIDPPNLNADEYQEHPSPRIFEEDLDK